MILNLSDKQDLYRFDVSVSNLKKKGATVEIEEIKPSRTLSQNRAIHLYCEMIADTLNEQGRMFHFNGIKGAGIEIRYTQILVKETLWRPIQMALFDKDSTTKLTTEEVGKIAEHIEMFFAKQGIDLPFPSID
ncbi:hypothetical protein [Petrimonas sulfuriphila]|uniref:hypothetical protein n=1 Tax=Petrimonas sulfuriphila TaxID=285070 RepID=UPI003EC06396